MDNSKTQTSEAALRQQIRQERAREQVLRPDDVYRRIIDGEIVGAVGNLLFHTTPVSLDEKLQIVLHKVSQAYLGGEIGLQMNILNFLVKLSVGLQSFLPNWVILKELDNDVITDMAEKASNVLGKLIEVGGKSHTELEARLRHETIARLKAEGVCDEIEAATLSKQLMGDSLADYVSNIVSELNRSNLIEVAGNCLRGKTQTQLGNDYAALLQHVIWLGGSFVTTNPVLIKLAWDIDPELWNDRIDALICSKYAASELEELLKSPASNLNTAIEAINSMVNMAVVIENCRLLRDIFLVTEGGAGYVSLQVNPKNHNDYDRMVAEARKVYTNLENSLGGVPNVVFKLPGTAAGMHAAEQLTSKGIGVNITVEFSVFQAIGFGEILKKGKALVSYLAMMNGRMAYPVRDEMQHNSVKGGLEAARWAGVEVARKAYRLLYEPPSKGGFGIDLRRVKLLIASLRVYDNWVPDISELLGVPVITVFPDIRRVFDHHKRDLRDQTILNETPPDVMEVLFKSEIFRQAWWIPGDPEQYKPARVLTLQLDDSEALAKWPPVSNTLGQFIDLYEQMGEMAKKRMQHIAALQKN